jgi:hypothetical protein
MRFIRTFIERLCLCWHVLRGRRTSLYRNIVDGNPTAFRIVAEKIESGDSALIVQCVVSAPHLRDGITTGGHSTVIGCCVQGVARYGMTGK